MSKAIENLEAAFQRAMAIRPRVGGFPYMAETFWQAGVTRNIWSLPACQSLYLTELGPVVTIGAPLSSGKVDVPPVSGFMEDDRVRDQHSIENFYVFPKAFTRADLLNEVERVLRVRQPNAVAS